MAGTITKKIELVVNCRHRVARLFSFLKINFPMIKVHIPAVSANQAMIKRRMLRILRRCRPIFADSVKVLRKAIIAFFCDLETNKKFNGKIFAGTYD